MSDTKKTKRSCKNKRLTGHPTDENMFSFSDRLGNNRHMAAKLKKDLRRRKKRREQKDGFND